MENQLLNNEKVKDFITFLEERKNVKSGQSSHTIIGKMLGFNCGIFYIDEKSRANFIKLYTETLSICRKMDIPLHLIEKPCYVGPIIIDIDLKQKNKDRQYDVNTIKYIINMCNNCIREYVKTDDNKIEAFVFEKKSPDLIRNKNNLYKDGLHIIYPWINIKASDRYTILQEIKEMVAKENGFKFADLNENTYDNIFDENIVMRNGLIMYGSQKPNSEIYELTHVYNNELIEKDVDLYSLEDKIILSSVRMADQNLC